MGIKTQTVSTPGPAGTGTVSMTAPVPGHGVRAHVIGEPSLVVRT